MKCPACGTEVDVNAVYCPKCGERVDTQEQEPFPPSSAEQYEEGFASGAPVEEEKPAASAGPAQTASDRLKESVAARQDAADDVEEELWQGRYAKRTMIGTWLLCGLISVLLLALGIWINNAILWWIILVVLLLMWGYPAILLMYRRLSIRYRLTSQRFFHEKGILRHVTDRIEMIDMDDISFDQTILQRIVKVGTIHISSSDRSHPILDIHGIENVKEVFSKMDQARRNERIRRGLHIESV